jgi:hypothetical protein
VQDTWTIAYDCTLKRPGCILLQAAMGATVPRERFFELFPVETWLLASTDDMKCYRTTDAQLVTVSKLTKTG